MDNSLFRKSSLERISSAEQLNEYVKIMNPRLWLVLSGFFVLVIAVVIWACTGTIPDTVKYTGVAFSETKGDEAVYCYMPLSASKKLSQGMAVQVSPDYAPREEYGYIYGKVESIGEKPITEADLVKTFGNIQYVQGIVPQGNVVEIKVSLKRSEGQLIWSNQKGQSIAVTSGSNCNLLIVTKERKPYELILN